MLNDWSDREPERKRRPVTTSREYWWGVASVFVLAVIALGVYGTLVG